MDADLPAGRVTEAAGVRPFGPDIRRGTLFRFLGAWMGRRKGFTFIELLVVLALVAVLLAFLLPAVARVRGAALNAVCLSRLRDLSLACTLYFADHDRTYPELNATSQPGLPPGLAPLLTPQNVDAAFLNDLAEYIRFPAVSPGTPAVDLPPAVQCPLVEDVEEGRDRLLPLSLSPAVPSYYTGYGYYGNLGNRSHRPLPGLKVLKPERVPSRRNGPAPGVLWADDLHWTQLGGGAWSYSHRRGCPAPGPLPLTYAGPEWFAGQHRAYANGVVEWVPAEELDLPRGQVDGFALPGRGASVEIGSAYFCWF